MLAPYFCNGNQLIVSILLFEGATHSFILGGLCRIVTFSPRDLKLGIWPQFKLNVEIQTDTWAFYTRYQSP